MDLRVLQLLSERIDATCAARPGYVPYLQPGNDVGGINVGFLVSSRLTADGVWRLATDWADYAEAMRETLDDHPRLVNCHDGWAPRWQDRPRTKYEQKGGDAGRTIYDLCYRLGEGG